MIEHEAIWGAFDEIARRLNTTRSGLATAAGLDPTSLNKGRECIGGMPRWPTLKTIVRILNLAGMTMTDFGKIVDNKGKNK